MRLKSIAIWVSVLVLFAVVVLCVFAPLVAPEDPNVIHVRERLAAPGDGSLLGRDYLGRDIWSRIVYGARVSLLVGASAAVFSALGGIAVGLVGGYSRGFLGGLLMRIVDTIMAFPATLLALAMMAVLGARVSNIVIALSVTYIPRIARIQHAATLQVREMQYVEAANAIGVGTPRLLLRHILPNTLGPILVQTSFVFAGAVIAEAGLSFLGVGTPTGTPSWGNMLSDGRSHMLSAPWITLFPGIAILCLTLSLNTIGDALRDLLDPKLGRSKKAKRGAS